MERVNCDDTIAFLVLIVRTLASSLINHFHELLVGHILSQLLGNSLNIIETDLSHARIVKDLEAAEQLFLRVSLAVKVLHDREELIIRKDCLVFLQAVLNDLFALFFCKFKTYSLEGNLKLLHKDGSLILSIEKFEAFPYLLLLLVSQNVLQLSSCFFVKLCLGLFKLLKKESQALMRGGSTLFFSILI